MLERILAGQQNAAAWLYDTFAARLYRRLKLRYGYPGGLDADDLLQDAFVLYFRGNGKALQRFLDRVPEAEQTVERLERFLWDQACGLATNRLRSAARRKVVAIDEYRSTASAVDPEQAVAARDAMTQLANCIEQSSERTFLYFKLRYLDGLSPEEITTVTGWSRKSTYKRKQLLNQALERCAKLLGISVA
jgi:RNA polymerase sigma factor (sigma-70 family)